MPRTSVPIIPRRDQLAPFRAALTSAVSRTPAPVERIVFDGWLDDSEGYRLGSCYSAAEPAFALRSLLRAAGAWQDVDPAELTVDDDAGTISHYGLLIGRFSIAPRVVASSRRVA